MLEKETSQFPESSLEDGRQRKTQTIKERHSQHFDHPTIVVIHHVDLENCASVGRNDPVGIAYDGPVGIAYDGRTTSD